MSNHAHDSDERYSLKVYSPEEIEFFMSGDRREVDRLLLHGMNNLAIVLVAHAKEEEAVFKSLGTPDVVKLRAEWVDAQIKTQALRNTMMNKIIESTSTWAVILFLGFTLKSIGEYIYSLLKVKLGGG